MPYLVLLGFVLGAAYLYRRSQATADSTPAPGGKPEPQAGTSSVAACRAAVPAEPKLVATSAMLGGHVYSGQDPALVQWLRSSLTQRADAATGEERRGTLAFAALQGREGSTAAINTYDNQVLTWGTGWGGLGGLPRVMDRLVAASPEVVRRLADCGVKYLGGGNWAVDDGAGNVVTGKGAALQVIRQTPALLRLFIALAKDPATREAVADAQLATFLASSGKVAGSETIATQALYNFVTHLKHWAPGYLAGAVQAATATVPGAPSADRDRTLAPAIVRAFYAAAPPNAYVVKGWSQVQRYVRDMRGDGLDVTNDPVFTSASPPPSAKAVA